MATLRAAGILLASLISWSCQQGSTVSTTKGNTAIECDESLFPVMQFQAEDFHNTYGEGNVKMLSVEARAAVVDFMNDSTRVIVLGRQFNKEELNYIKNVNIEYQGFKVALDAIIVIINMQNRDSTMRITELDSIYRGERTSWGGGRKGLIDAYVGDVNSSVDENFKEQILNGKAFGSTVTRLESSEKIIEEVRKNPNAIGLVGLSWLHGHEQDVRVCRLGGGAYRPVMRAKATIEGVKNNQQRIVITEPPLQIERPAYVEQIKELIGNKTLNNVSSIRDESEGNRTRIVLTLGDQVDADEVLSSLQRQTQTVDTTLVPGQFFSPAQAHVLRKYYPVSREVYMYTREARRDVGYGFIAYVKDRKGQQNFVNHGLVPAAMPVRMVTTTAEKVQ